MKEKRKGNRKKELKMRGTYWVDLLEKAAVFWSGVLK